MRMLDFFKTGPDRPILADAGEIRRIYEHRRRTVFFGLVFGYSFYYVCRLTISIAKKPIIDSGVLNAEQLGTIGFAFFIAYAFGKLINGFLADRSHIGRLMSTGLLVSAVILVLFGFTTAFWVFVALWGVNGWFQAMGSAPSGASISQWFSNRERGTRYSIWSSAHPIGEGISMVATAAIITYLGWQWGFWVAGSVSIAVALLLFKLLADRPRAYGLPTVADYKNDHTVESVTDDNDVNRAQFEVLKNPYVWILGLSCTAVYIARYGINSWGPMYLQEAKDYTLITAGLVLGWAKTLELAGAISSGLVSDRLFGSRRNVPTLLYGLLMTAGLLVLYASPSTHIADLDLSQKAAFSAGPVGAPLRAVFQEKGIPLPARSSVEVYGGGDAEKSVWLVKNDRWYLFWTGYAVEETPSRLKVTAKYRMAHLGGVALFCFGLGGMLVFVGGLIAIDICSKRASGAAMGLVGMFSYLGAAVQDWVSGKLIQAGAMTVDGRAVHDFNNAFLFWIGAAVAAVLLTCVLWNVKAKD
ncbi:MAG: MFS transporter [Candidatus Hydrogenedens sp.]|nr:MFS transporter [Candidatus Hydrogenedentota bacterium]NLF58405.1 MFS transporter [Candidatus Hydrogenedens sp.]